MGSVPCQCCIATVSKHRGVCASFVHRRHCDKLKRTELLTGCPRHTGQICVFGCAPYSFLHRQKALVRVLSWIWHSMPITASYATCNNDGQPQRYESQGAISMLGAVACLCLSFVLRGCRNSGIHQATARSALQFAVLGSERQCER